mgnify:CR=1 FL=1|jgi:hypothetical protein
MDRCRLSEAKRVGNLEEVLNMALAVSAIPWLMCHTESETLLFATLKRSSHGQPLSKNDCYDGS